MLNRPVRIESASRAPFDEVDAVRWRGEDLLDDVGHRYDRVLWLPRPAAMELALGRGKARDLQLEDGPRS
jgi:hypothetical protein